MSVLQSAHEADALDLRTLCAAIDEFPGIVTTCSSRISSAVSALAPHGPSTSPVAKRRPGKDTPRSSSSFGCSARHARLGSATCSSG